jgi:hypothetical protein
LTPLFYTIGRYAANHTMTTCLSKGACEKCSRALHFLGMDVEHVGGMDLCESALMSAYTEAIHHPFYSMELATKGIELIKEAIKDLAAMPAMATTCHQELAKIIGLNEAHTVKTVNDILAKGKTIYAKNTAWLYVGLPEVLSRIKNISTKDENAVALIVHDVYEKWRVWGIQQQQNMQSNLAHG